MMKLKEMNDQIRPTGDIVSDTINTTIPDEDFIDYMSLDFQNEIKQAIRIRMKEHLTNSEKLFTLKMRKYMGSERNLLHVSNSLQKRAENSAG